MVFGNKDMRKARQEWNKQITNKFSGMPDKQRQELINTLLAKRAELVSNQDDLVNTMFNGGSPIYQDMLAQASQMFQDRLNEYQRDSERAYEAYRGEFQKQIDARNDELAELKKNIKKEEKQYAYLTKEAGFLAVELIDLEDKLKVQKNSHKKIMEKLKAKRARVREGNDTAMQKRVEEELRKADADYQKQKAILEDTIAQKSEEAREAERVAEAARIEFESNMEAIEAIQDELLEQRADKEMGPRVEQRQVQLEYTQINSIVSSTRKHMTSILKQMVSSHERQIKGRQQFLQQKTNQIDGFGIMIDGFLDSLGFQIAAMKNVRNQGQLIGDLGYAPVIQMAETAIEYFEKLRGFMQVLMFSAQKASNASTGIFESKMVPWEHVLFAFELKDAYFTDIAESEEVLATMGRPDLVDSEAATEFYNKSNLNKFIERALAKAGITEDAMRMRLNELAENENTKDKWYEVGVSVKEEMEWPKFDLGMWNQTQGTPQSPTSVDNSRTTQATPTYESTVEGLLSDLQEETPPRRTGPRTETVKGFKMMGDSEIVNDINEIFGNEMNYFSATSLRAIQTTASESPDKVLAVVTGRAEMSTINSTVLNGKFMIAGSLSRHLRYLLKKTGKEIIEIYIQKYRGA
jgi:hypothetical protein